MSMDIDGYATVHPMSFPPPAMPAPPPAPPSPNYTVRTILIIVGVLAVGTVIFVNRDKTTTTERDTTRRVVYTVSARGDVTMTTPDGTVQQQAVKGQVGAFTFEPGDFVYLSVQNANPGSITCTIKVDGQIVSTNTASGRFSIATCDGSA